MHKPIVMSGGRYPVLRSIALLYIIGAGLAALIGLIGAIYAVGWSPNSWTGRLALAASLLAATFFVCLSLLAIAEVLKLFMDIEHNSRMAAGRLAAENMVGADGKTVAVMPDLQHTNRVAMLDEETAEGALLRGH